MRTSSNHAWRGSNPGLATRSAPCLLQPSALTRPAFETSRAERSVWNQVDFTIVLISILVLVAEAVPQLRSLRVLRVLRVLRPLRLVSRNAGMKLIITSLFKAMPAVSNVIGVVFSLQVVFAIIGMQLFSGTMASCSDPTILSRDLCVEPGTGPPSLPMQLPLPPPLTAAELPLPPLPPLLNGTRMLAEEKTPSLRWANPALGSFDNFGEA